LLHENLIDAGGYEPSLKSMPSGDRGVDSISSGLHNHDSTGGKVDSCNLSTGNRDARPTISRRQGASEARALRPTERNPFEKCGHIAVAALIDPRDGVGQGAQMLDNSRR
jgi:hypothetical protein